MMKNEDSNLNIELTKSTSSLPFKQAILYLPYLYYADEIETQRRLCRAFAVDNGYVVDTETDDPLYLYHNAVKEKYAAVIVPSYYAFIENPYCFNFKQIFENRNIELLSMTESFDNCYDLISLYDYYN